MRDLEFSCFVIPVNIYMYIIYNNVVQFMKIFFQNIFYHPLDCGKFNLLSPIHVLMCLFSFEFSVKPKSQFGHLWGRSPVCINICLLRLPLLANDFPGQKGQEALPALEVQIWTWNNSSFFFVITQIYFVKCFLSQFWVDASFCNWIIAKIHW